MTRVAYPINGYNPSFVRSAAASRTAAEALGMQLIELDFSAPDQLESAFAMARALQVEALSVGADTFFAARMSRIVAVAARERLPTIYSGRVPVEMGGLMGYGPSFRDNWRRAAGYVDKILRGAKPGDLPVEQPATFEFVGNVRTAHALGFALPPKMEAQVAEWVS